MGDFEVRLINIRKNIESSSEDILEMFEEECKTEIDLLKSEIIDLQQNFLGSNCSLLGQAVYNYITFLEGCIEVISETIHEVRKNIEYILINSL